MRITYGELKLERIVKRGSAKYAYLSQKVTRDNAVGEEDREEHLLGFQNGQCTRSVYYRVPANTTEDDFELFLQSYPDARIIRLIDHEPILSSKQRERIEQKVISKADIAKSQVVMEPNQTLYIDNFGFVVYGQNRLSLSNHLSDQDHRWQSLERGVTVEQEVMQAVISKTQLSKKGELKHD